MLIGKTGKIARNKEETEMTCGKKGCGTAKKAAKKPAKKAAKKPAKKAAKK